MNQNKTVYYLDPAACPYPAPDYFSQRHSILRL